MGQSFPVIQIVGFQNSGKTTLMEKLIKTATEKGLQVASFKHHGHGGVLRKPLKAKDSDKHQQAGAIVSGVEGNGCLHIESNRDAWSLSEIVELYGFFQPDVLFVEGFKQEHFPKVIVIRDENDWLTMNSLSNILCVFSRMDIACKIQSVPTFLADEHEHCISFILNHI